MTVYELIQKLKNYPKNYIVKLCIENDTDAIIDNQTDTIIEPLIEILLDEEQKRILLSDHRNEPRFLTVTNWSPFDNKE